MDRHSKSTLNQCPRCGSEWQPTIAFSGTPSEFWVECSNPNCNTYLNTFKPQAHQREFHLDTHRVTANFGGYGSGKTTTTREELFKHMFITPGGNAIVGANVMSQYEQTLQRELEADIPKAFVQYKSTQKSFMDLINGYRIMYRPFDDAEKLRSYNVDFFVMLEASEINKASFTQLKTRLRNLSATVPATDDRGEILTRTQNGVEVPIIKSNWMRGIIESNPSAGWIRDEVLLNSSAILKHGTIKDNYQVDEQRADPKMSTHVTSTDANAYLPEDFIEQNSSNKPMWWINRYLYGSFLYAEGLVYPNFRKVMVDDFEIPANWKRIVAYDYGLSDDSVFIFGAIDEKRRKLVIYKEVRTSNKNVQQLADIFKKASQDIGMGLMICPPIIDPKSGPKRNPDMKTLNDQFAEYGIYFMNGQVNKDARIFRLNSYIESETIEIFKSCRDLERELDGYKFKADETMASGFSGKPVDKDDHGICGLEFLVMELPSDPSNLIRGVYDRMGRDITQPKTDEEALECWALMDDEEEQEALWSPY